MAWLYPLCFDYVRFLSWKLFTSEMSWRYAKRGQKSRLGNAVHYTTVLDINHALWYFRFGWKFCPLITQEQKERRVNKMLNLLKSCRWKATWTQTARSTAVPTRGGRRIKQLHFRVRAPIFAIHRRSQLLKNACRNHSICLGRNIKQIGKSI